MLLFMYVCMYVILKFCRLLSRRCVCYSHQIVHESTKEQSKGGQITLEYPCLEFTALKNSVFRTCMIPKKRRKKTEYEKTKNRSPPRVLTVSLYFFSNHIRIFRWTLKMEARRPQMEWRQEEAWPLPLFARETFLLP